MKEFLISKEEFVEYINFIHRQSKKQDKFLEAIDDLADGKEYCNCFLYASYEDKVVKLLGKLTHDIDDDLGYFLYEHHDGFPTDSAGQSIYHDASTLYDYLLKQYNLGISD